MFQSCFIIWIAWIHMHSKCVCVWLALCRNAFAHEREWRSLNQFSNHLANYRHHWHVAKESVFGARWPPMTSRYQFEKKVQANCNTAKLVNRDRRNARLQHCNIGELANLELVKWWIGEQGTEDGCPGSNTPQGWWIIFFLLSICRGCLSLYLVFLLCLCCRP